MEAYSEAREGIRKLAISDAPMFQRVMSDAEICRKFVEVVLEVDIAEIVYHSTEQTIEPGLGRHGVRFDAYLKDGSSVYDIEMQSYPRHGLGRRMRYYQSAMDTELLGKGESYDKLPESYIIFVCTHDPLGLGLARYDLERICVQDGRAPVECGAHWVALNSQAYQMMEGGSLRSMLEYICDGTVNSDPFVRLIDEAVSNANRDSKWVREVFCGISEAEDLKIQARIEKEIARKEGLAEGREQGRRDGFEQGMRDGMEQGIERGIEQGIEQGALAAEDRYGKLVAALLGAGRIADLEAMTSDADLRATLYKEYDL